MIPPRYAWSPKCARSLGQECVEFWRSAGGVLFDWQAFAIEGMLGLSEEDHWVSSNDGLDVARQNGKGVILQAIEVYFAFELGYPVVMHTAHEFSTSLEHQLRLERMIQECPHLHSKVREKGGYVHANGQESIRLRSGCRIIFKARTKGGGRGYSGDLLVWDEAMIIPTEVVGAQKSMLRASQAIYGPKTIYAGSAVDQDVHAHGIPFALIRERGIAETPGVSWHEWSAPYESPDEMTIDVLRDRTWWPLANPSIADGLIDPDYMAEEIETNPARVTAVELGGVGDWPATDGSKETVISIHDWDDLCDPDSKLEAPFCLAFDVSPERKTAIAVGGMNQNGQWHVEIQEHRQGTSWVVDRIVEMVERGEPDIVVCDALGPAASLIVPLAERGVRVEAMSSPEHAQSCGRLLDMVEEQSLAHLGSEDLRDAIRGAKQRPMGDAWAWHRRNSSVDISPLVAATLALGAAAGIGVGELAIY